MHVDEMLGHLDRAQQEIKLVEDQLDDSAHACPSCGLTIREDFTQYQLRENLAATRTKLRRVAGSLTAHPRVNLGA